MSNIVYLLLILDNFSHALGATQVLCLEGARHVSHQLATLFMLINYHLQTDDSLLALI